MIRNSKCRSISQSCTYLAGDLLRSRVFLSPLYSCNYGTLFVQHFHSWFDQRYFRVSPDPPSYTPTQGAFLPIPSCSLWFFPLCFSLANSVFLTVSVSVSVICRSTQTPHCVSQPILHTLVAVLLFVSSLTTTPTLQTEDLQSGPSNLKLNIHTFRYIPKYTQLLQLGTRGSFVTTNSFGGRKTQGLYRRVFFSQEKVH